VVVFNDLDIDDLIWLGGVDGLSFWNDGLSFWNEGLSFWNEVPVPDRCGIVSLEPRLEWILLISCSRFEDIRDNLLENVSSRACSSAAVKSRGSITALSIATGSPRCRPRIMTAQTTSLDNVLQVPTNLSLATNRGLRGRLTSNWRLENLDSSRLFHMPRLVRK
jgi:hypothetical protein